MASSNLGNAKRLLQEVMSTSKETVLYSSKRKGKQALKIKSEYQRILNKYGVGLAKAAKMATIEVGLEALEAAVNKAPVDTGKLVESAELHIGHTLIAKGRVESIDKVSKIAETEIEMVAKIDTNNLVPSADDLNMYKKGRFNIYLSFERSSKEMPELALFLHENLNDYGEDRPAALMQGRGGKFIEVPFNDAMDQLYKRVESKVKQSSKYIK